MSLQRIHISGKIPESKIYQKGVEEFPDKTYQFSSFGIQNSMAFEQIKVPRLSEPPFLGVMVNACDSNQP